MGHFEKERRRKRTLRRVRQNTLVGVLSIGDKSEQNQLSDLVRVSKVEVTSQRSKVRSRFSRLALHHLRPGLLVAVEPR